MMDEVRLDMVHFTLGSDAVFSISSYDNEISEVAIITDDGFVSPQNWADMPADSDATSIQIADAEDLKNAVELALIWLSEQ